ncbi:Kinesin-like protein KIF22-B [Hordeum vulgare]|nr:Kinesin-like protein KIF22-B [Hordeum vulgare]
MAPPPKPEYSVPPNWHRTAYRLRNHVVRDTGNRKPAPSRYNNGCFYIPCFPWHNVQCFSVKISYYEVYMERCYDLLEPKAKEIMALDNNLGNLQLKGLAWAPVRSAEEIQEVYSIGEDESLVGRLFGTKCVRALLCESERDNHAELETVNSWNK